MFRRKNEPLSVRPQIVYASVILANPGQKLEELNSRIIKLRKRYNLGQVVANPSGVYQKSFYGFITRLEDGRYTKTGTFRNLDSLKEEGVRLLERIVLKGFAADPETMRTLAGDANLGLDVLLGRYIQRTLELFWD